MRALVEGVRRLPHVHALLAFFSSNVSAGEALLAVYKFHAKLLFFAVSSFRLISHCSSMPMCLFRPKIMCVYLDPKKMMSY
jgi:hypothetical protein